MDKPLSFPRERDDWLMLRFARLGYSEVELDRLNRVRIHQQAVFLSCVANARGTDIDSRYLKPRPPNQKWSELKFAKEKPPPSDFRLWKQALIQLIPAGGLSVSLGRCLHRGYKCWEWRVSPGEGYLLHYREILWMFMSVLQPRAAGGENGKTLVSQCSSDPRARYGRWERIRRSSRQKLRR